MSGIFVSYFYIGASVVLLTTLSPGPRLSPASDAASPAARSAVPVGVGRGLLNKGGDGPEV